MGKSEEIWKKTEESSWSSVHWKFVVGDSLVREQPKKTWSEVVRHDLGRSKVNKELANDGNV